MPQKGLDHRHHRRHLNILAKCKFVSYIIKTVMYSNCFSCLQGVEQELLECQALVEDADRLASAVSTVSGVSDMMSEYRALFADVRTRLDLARAEVVGDVDSAVQVRNLMITRPTKPRLGFLSRALHHKPLLISSS